MFWLRTLTLSLDDILLHSSLSNGPYQKNSHTLRPSLRRSPALESPLHPVSDHLHCVSPRILPPGWRPLQLPMAKTNVSMLNYIKPHGPGMAQGFPNTALEASPTKTMENCGCPRSRLAVLLSGALGTT